MPWGTASNTDTATALINTCPIDNVLTILTLLHTMFDSVRNFMDTPPQQHLDLATTITRVLQYVRNRNFNAAKLLWLSGVAKKHLSSFPCDTGAYNLTACEDELSLSVLEPFLSSLAITRTCEDHGVVYETTHNITAMGIVGRTPVEILHHLKPLPFDSQIPCGRDSKMNCEKLLQTKIVKRASLAPFLVITPHAPAGFTHELSMAPRYADIYNEVYDLVAITVRRDGHKCLAHFFALLYIENEWYVADGMKPQLEKYKETKHKFNVFVSVWYVKQ